MKYELYIDAFFLLNFFMDTLLLFLIRKILKCTATPLRLFLGGAFGAGMACVVTVMPFLPVWIKLLAGYGFIKICMIRISFPGMHRAVVFRAAVYLYGFAFLFGGVLEFLTVQIPFFRIYGIGIMGICMTGMSAAAVIHFLYGRWQEGRNRNLVPVKIVWQDRELLLQALIDTGNSLYEPVSGKPVSIVEREAVRSVFAGGKPEIFRAIPFHSIGRAHGILEGYQITELIILGENEKIKIEKPFVGLFDGKLSARAAYRMILHPALMKHV